MIFILSIILVYKITNVFAGLIEKNNILNNANDITNGRLDLWFYSFSEFKNRPLLGLGFKNIYKVTGVDVHNVYIQVLAEAGIVGFVIFIFALLALFIKPIKFSKYIKRYNNKEKFHSNIMGLYLSIYFVLYGFVSNTFIEYIPLSLFILSIYMANNINKENN